MISQNASMTEALIRDLYPSVFNLCLRMRLVPDDAADATQEILVKAIEAYPSFRGASSVKTWALAIARNHVLSMLRAGPRIEFSQYEEEAAAHLADPGAYAAYEPASLSERAREEEDLKIACTTALLQCLDPLDRLCYVLYAFFGLPSAECSGIAGLSPEAYRQRVSRARSKLASFLGEHCGAAGGATCSCRERLGYAKSRGRLMPGSPYAARREKGENISLREASSVIEAREELDAASSFYRAEPALLPVDVERRIARLLMIASPVIDPEGP